MAAYRFPYLLAGDSVVFKHESEYYEHFYADLKPYIHYIPYKKDLSDLVKQVEWAQSHEEEVSVLTVCGVIGHFFQQFNFNFNSSNFLWNDD